MSDVKDFFISRYDGGFIVEADYSQLEVIYLAHITKDKQLIEDLLSGVDMHRVRAAELFSVSLSAVTPAMRKTAKAFSFMLQYGAGANHMAEKAKTTTAMARKFIENYYNRYPEVKMWQSKMFSTVKAGAYKIPQKSPKGFPLKESKIVSETGRIYTFKEGDAPEWMASKGKETSFKPTEVKNYPIQGGATGDIVPMMLGQVNRMIVENGFIKGVKFIGTVHDSMIFDVHPDSLHEFLPLLKKVLESAPEAYEQNFGVPIDLPMKVEINYGPNWGDTSIEFKG